MIPAPDALARLRDGNCHFVCDQREHSAYTGDDRRRELTDGQTPFAIILGCSDSRAPAEIIFDQGLGDLFVIRVAENIVDASQVGSVEFAAEKFGTRLVVVMGHTGCGAVGATIEELERPTPDPSPNFTSIIERIRPSVESLLATANRDDPEAFLELAVRANIRASADHLRHGSPVLERLVREDDLVIVGAEYALATGAVDFFDGIPSEA